MLREKIEAQKALEKSQAETFTKIAEIAKQYDLCLAIGGYRKIADDVASMPGLEKVVYHNNIYECWKDNCIFRRKRGFIGRYATIILSFNGFDAGSLDLVDINFLDMAEKVESVLLEWSSVSPEDLERRKFWKCKYCGAVNEKGLECSNCGAPIK